jgi:hypothetical protein
MTTTREDVLKMEKRFWTESGEPGFFQSAMKDDAITVIEPMGFITKDQAIKMTEPGSSWSGLEMEDVKFVDLTPDCVALAYHAKAKNDKTGQPYRGSINSVYVRQGGEWKLGMTSHQPWPEKQA